MSGEADEAGGLSPGHEENEAGRGFRPEKPYLPLSIEGIASFLLILSHPPFVNLYFLVLFVLPNSKRRLLQNSPK